jgi:hypothetical protein
MKDFCAMTSNSSSSRSQPPTPFRLRDVEVILQNNTECSTCRLVQRPHDYEQTSNSICLICRGCGSTVQETILHLPIFKLSNDD